jgi:hypothetical protein
MLTTLSDRLTCSDAINIYKNVICAVLGITNKSHPLRLTACDGITSLITLLGLSSHNIDILLTYLPDQVDGESTTS